MTFKDERKRFLTNPRGIFYDVGVDDVKFGNARSVKENDSRLQIARRFPTALGKERSGGALERFIGDSFRRN